MWKTGKRANLNIVDIVARIVVIGNVDVVNIVIIIIVVVIVIIVVAVGIVDEVGSHRGS